MSFKTFASTCLATWLGATLALGDLNPRDVYAQGYRLVQEGVKAEQASDSRRALQSYRNASDTFDSISQRWPAWMPSMLDYRRKLVRADVQRLAARFADGGGANEPELPQRSVGPSARTGATQPNSIARPPSVPSPQERYKQLEDYVHRLTADREKLVGQLAEKQADQREAQKALEDSRRQVENLRLSLEKSQSELQKLKGAGVEALQAQIEDLKKRLAEATESMKLANERTAKLLADLEAAHKLIAELRTEQELLKRDRDNMADMIKGLREEEGPLQLASENIRLREQLNATQAKLDELQAATQENPDKEELESLRKEVSDLRSQLAAVQQENEDYKIQLKELQESLGQIDQNLTLNPPAIGDENAQAENALLKQVIGKQLRQQAFRQQKLDLVMNELKGDLEPRSDKLVMMIEELAQDAELSPNEKEVLLAGGVSAGQAPISADVPVVEDDIIKRKITRYAKAAAYDFSQGAYEKAEAQYEEILQFAPRHVRTLCNLGVVKLRLNKLDDAKMLYEQALLEDNANGFTHYMLGVTQFHLDDLDGAALSLEKCAELDSQNAEALHFLGVVQLRRGDLAKAEESLNKAIELKAQSPEAQYNLAVVHASRAPADLVKARHHYTLAKQAGLSPDEKMERLLGARADSSVPQPKVEPEAPPPAPVEPKAVVEEAPQETVAVKEAGSESKPPAKRPKRRFSGLTRRS